MKSKFARFIDNLSICLIAFIMSFVILKTFIKKSLIVLLISLAFSFIVLKIILYFQNKTLKKLSISAKEKQDIIDCNFALRKLSLVSQITFFKNLFQDKQVTKTPNGLIIENQIYFYIALNLDIINPEQIFSIYSKAKNVRNKNIQEICIVLNSISEEAKLSIKNLSDISFSIFSPVETFALMKQHTFYPTLPKKPIKTQTFTFKQAFIKKKGKSYIRCGILLYLVSLFSPFTYYYLIFASIITFLGFALLLFGKETSIKKSISEELLLSKSTF